MNAVISYVPRFSNQPSNLNFSDTQISTDADAPRKLLIIMKSLLDLNFVSPCIIIKFI